MDINHIFSAQRTGKESLKTSSDTRSEFQRDFDRIIFSSAFRRLQNKTQVFPLPGSVFVHNRLTHSLEVASVGRSLGSLTGDFILDKYKDLLSEESKDFYSRSLYNVVAAACLCHDIGNPAFGHSGEDAIASFFSDNELRLKPHFSEKQWHDFIHFEGNANGMRILTAQQNGKAPGGQMLTYTTLASIAKYPCESIARDRKILHRKKFGFFQTEKELFDQIAFNTDMTLDKEEPRSYFRHPFVWLVEAADDICYTIIDLEDAHRLGIISHRDCKELLLALVNDLDQNSVDSTIKQLKAISNKNEKIAYLRAKSISSLILRSRDLLQEQCNNWLGTGLSKGLFDQIQDDSAELQEILRFSVKNIYLSSQVVEIENAGYNVMSHLLKHFVLPVVKEAHQRSKNEQMALKLIPNQFMYEHKKPYQRVIGIIDYVSGMTDNFAVSLYRKITGIEIGMSL